eukprot:scaffold18018_cov92-Isochrysis_galbana.AAC.1
MERRENAFLRTGAGCESRLSSFHSRESSPDRRTCAGRKRRGGGVFECWRKKILRAQQGPGRRDTAKRMGRRLRAHQILMQVIVPDGVNVVVGVVPDDQAIEPSPLAVPIDAYPMPPELHTRWQRSIRRLPALPPGLSTLRRASPRTRRSRSPPARTSLAAPPRPLPMPWLVV